MKPVSNVLHRTPWWALLLMGLAILLGLAAFVTPYHILDYRRDAATPEEQRQIKREIDNAFADNAIDFARSVLLSMRGATSDVTRREELNEALRGLDEARRELREAGAEVLRAKRQAADGAREAAAGAADAIREARKEALRALKEAGLSDEVVSRSFDESLAAVTRAQDAAKGAAKEDLKASPPPVAPLPPDAVPPTLPVPPEAAGLPAPTPAPLPPEGEKRRIRIQMPGHKAPMLDIDVEGSAGRLDAPPLPPLPPQLRSQIRENVTRDLYRIGVGAGLILIFIPIFIVLIVAKFFIDRSRAAQRLAELKRKEAEYHRMSQQVTEAKLSALQAQVEPHFLYNTLASVQALTEVDPQKANDMTGHLIQYLRNALPKMRESVSTIGQEVELVRAYLNILQMRMGKRLTFAIAVPPELMDRPFPPLMLPSLVENSIKHGLEPQREGGEVRITAEEENGRLRLVVSDTGRGFAESTAGGGVGLTNLRERLAAMYGADGLLTLVPREPHGVVATIEVPSAGARQSDPGAVPAGPAAAETALAANATKTQKTLRAMGTAERMWRKGLSFAFVVLVVIAAVVSGLAIVGVSTGLLPVQVGDGVVGGPHAALLGTAGIAAAFAVVVLALAIVLAVVYGLGFLFAGLAIFIPLVVIVTMSPALAPIILVGLAIWWFVRRGRRKKAAALASPAPPPPDTPPIPGAQ